MGLTPSDKKGILVIATLDASNRSPIINSFFTKGEAPWSGLINCDESFGKVIDVLANGDTTCTDSEWIEIPDGPFIVHTFEVISPSEIKVYRFGEEHTVVKLNNEY